MLHINPSLYLVGGYLRDKYLGVPSKDIDYAVEGVSYYELRDWLLDNNYRLCEEDPTFLRIKAGKRNFKSKGPKEIITHREEVWELPVAMIGAPIDFVLCRKDGKYTDLRHPDEVEPCSILEDLGRRDFTVNAMAVKVDTQELIDPFGGKEDLKAGILRAVGNATERFQEDPLRILRGIRFAVTKGFAIEAGTFESMHDNRALLEQVEPNRIREELVKAFKKDTLRTLGLLERSCLSSYVFNKDTQLWLKPTSEK